METRRKSSLTDICEDSEVHSRAVFHLQAITRAISLFCRGMLEHKLFRLRQIKAICATIHSERNRSVCLTDII